MVHHIREQQRQRAVLQQRREQNREDQVDKEKVEQAMDERFLILREQIRSVEDLRLTLQEKKLLLYVDLAPLKERELYLQRRLASLLPAELASTDALRSEIAEYNRIYNEYEINSDEKSVVAQRELTKKQRALKENCQVISVEVSAALRQIDDMLRSPGLQTWFGTTLTQYNTQLEKISNVVRRINPDLDGLQNSIYLTENLKRMVRRIRTRCASFRDTMRSISPDTDTEEAFLYGEPFYFRFPSDRIPARILDRIKTFSETGRE